MKNNINNIIVAGGGTAGFVAALILKTCFNNCEVSVIKSDKIGIVGVGEGATEHWNEFMKYVGIHYVSVIKKCDATLKSGTMFVNWSKNNYMQSIGQEFDLKNAQYPILYGKVLAEKWPSKYLNPSLSWDNKVYFDYVNPITDLSPVNQYHFNTFKLNAFLVELCNNRNIKIYDDEIKDVNLNEQGEIESLHCTGRTYHADFFIDCTGFRKILISKLGAKWRSYRKYLRMNSAVVFPLEDPGPHNMYTTSRAMDYGWMFNTPVWDRTGNGYIFDRDFINAEQAQIEIEKLWNKKITIAKQIDFDPGALDKVWIKNCCAMGLSSSFVEPLEASSIGTTINQTFLLMHRLPNYTEKTIEKYNDTILKVTENIRDFIFLHYITGKDHNEFWKLVADLEWPDFLKEMVPKWQHNLPIAEDFSGPTFYNIFREHHFLQVLAGLKLFNEESIQKEYSMINNVNKQKADSFFQQIRNKEKTARLLDHSEFLDLIRHL